MIKTLLKTTGTAALCLSAFAYGQPVLAFGYSAPGYGIQVEDLGNGDIVEVRRGRSGTGVRGRDRDRSEDRSRGRDRDRSDDRSSGRDRPRIPGGSGCDDPGDIAEHPECRGNGGGATVTPPNDSGSGRDRPRIPGGSGCDDPGDILEHPECRV